MQTNFEQARNFFLRGVAHDEVSHAIREDQRAPIAGWLFWLERKGLSN
jgi:hypothetical protein